MGLRIEGQASTGWVYLVSRWPSRVKRREQAEEGVAGKKGWHGIANRRARILSTLLLICCSCGDDNEEE